MSAVIPVLNKTYYDSSAGELALTTTARTLFDSKEVVIQADKAFTVTTQLPYAKAAGSGWVGAYIGSSIQVNGVWYDMGNTGYILGMSNGSSRPERYFDTKYIDLVGEDIVTDDASYTIVVRTRGRMYAGTGAINSQLSFINDGVGNRGIEISEAALQNNISIIIQEKDRW